MRISILVVMAALSLSSGAAEKSWVLFPKPGETTRDQLKLSLNKEGKKFLRERQRAVSALRTGAEAAERQNVVREKILRLLGGLPTEKSPLRTRHVGTEERDGYDPDLRASKVGSTTEKHSHANGHAVLIGDNVARYRVWDGIRGIDYLLPHPARPSRRRSIPTVSEAFHGTCAAGTSESVSRTTLQAGAGRLPPFLKKPWILKTPGNGSFSHFFAG